MDNLIYLFIGFAVVWAVFFIYLFVLYGRQAGIKREIDALEGQTKEQRRA